MRFNIPNFNQYINLHKEELVDLIRIFMGFILVIKGLKFFFEYTDFFNLLTSIGLSGDYTILLFSHLVIIIHVVGGIFFNLRISYKNYSFTTNSNYFGSYLIRSFKDGFNVR